MPPKKKADAPSKKTVEKKKEKVIEDKTFGLKNKKGAKQQRFIKTVHTQVTAGGQTKASKVAAQQEADKVKKKDEKKKLQEEINALFRPVSQIVGKGVDPKSVLCAFFKQGQCGKGDKCKFSHDLNIERKQEKRNIYEKEGGMEDMDEAALEELVDKKHGESNKAKPQTSLICKHFLEAVEGNKYGWFWECPNGIKCIYRHALPPGFVLKRDLKKDDKEEKISIEELVEKERAALGHNVTRVTLETFLKWKERKKREKVKSLMKETEKKKADYKAGRVAGISGRQMFEFNPELMRNDDDEAQDAPIERERDEDDDVKVVDISMDTIVASDVDNSGTQAARDRLGPGRMVNGHDNESDKLDEAAALPPSAGASSLSPTAKQQEDADLAIAAAVSATINGDLEIDEDLFAEEDEDLIDELETLELEEMIQAES